MAERRWLPRSCCMAGATRLYSNNVGRGFAGGDAAVMTAGATQGHNAVAHFQWCPANAGGVANAALLSSQNMGGCFASGADAVVAAGAVATNT